ncbi:MAG: sialate O-acetylesterase [Clostridia bacterium]|nr:sialate O-acetylesterase [Clostridia bacterium]
MIHSFLMIGQSNMAGRGIPSEVEPIKNPAIKVLRNGLWQLMIHSYPVNPDRTFSGVCPAESFADAYQKDHGVEVGLIPCADGGTCLDQWQEGTLLYDHAVYMGKLAQRTSTIAGVLWHQGEGDCHDHMVAPYEEKFLKMMAALRRDLNLYDVPFLVGGLGDFLANYTYTPGPNCQKNYRTINEALKRIGTQPMTGFVSAEGLTSNPDLLHFNAVSQREFGLRYYEVFKTLENKEKVFEEKSESGIRSHMESL